MLRRKEEEKIDNISSIILIVSSILFCLLMAVMLLSDLSATLVFSAFFLLLSIEVLFFTINVESWYKESFYNFSKLFFFLSILLIFLGSFQTIGGDLGVLPVLDDVFFCLTYSLEYTYAGIVALIVFLSFLILYTTRNVSMIFRSIIEMFTERFWLKMILITALVSLIFIVFVSGSYMSCLNLGEPIGCVSNWLDQGGVEDSETCRTVCYDKYKVSVYEMRDLSCYCDINNCGI